MDGWIIIILSWRVSLLGCRDTLALGDAPPPPPLSSLSSTTTRVEGWCVGAHVRLQRLINVVLAARLLRVAFGGEGESLEEFDWKLSLVGLRGIFGGEGGTRRGYYKILMGRLKFGAERLDFFPDFCGGVSKVRFCKVESERKNEFESMRWRIDDFFGGFKLDQIASCTRNILWFDSRIVVLIKFELSKNR